MGLVVVSRLAMRTQLIVIVLSAFWLAIACAPEPDQREFRMKETWNFSEDSSDHGINWGGPGWYATTGEQFTVGGPIRLTIRLSDSRVLSGDFTMVRIVGDATRVSDITLDTEPTSLEMAYSVALDQLDSLGASTTEKQELDSWREQVGKDSAPGFLIYLHSTQLPEVSIEIPGTYTPSVSHLWMVSTSISWGVPPTRPQGFRAH